MSLFDILNSDKDKAALNAVIDHAVQALVGQLVPAIQTAGEALIDRFAARFEDVVLKANGAAQEDLQRVVKEATGLLHSSISDITTAIGSFDRSTITLNLGGGKQVGGI